ncbi:MAG: caspase family protein [Burkholderiaceae bacterium]|nr:caspase family protein [Burkholderiaceae bacterium]
MKSTCRFNKLIWTRSAIALSVLALAGVLGGCAAPGEQVFATSSDTGGDASSKYLVVDCLLPPQLIKMGEKSLHFTPSRLLKTSARLCEQQGGSQKAGLVAWLQVAATGNAEAQAYVGEMYQQGTGGAPRDFNKAIEWYEKAAKQGNSRAIINLAEVHANGGPGVAQDPEKAQELVKQSIQQVAGVETRQIEVVSVAALSEQTVDSSTSGTVDELLQRFKFGDYHALLIGNSDYRNMPVLNSPVNEVDKIGELLKSKYGFRVTTLKNATKNQILKALDDMNEALQPTDNLLVYYTGHGAQSENGQGYWLPVDGEGVQSSNKYRTRLWVSTSDVRDLLSVLSARHVLVVSDSCYSARFLQFRGALAAPSADPLASRQYLQSFEKIYTAKSRTALTSGGLAPVLEPTDGSNMSLFAKAFVQYLERNDVPIPSVNIFAAVQQEVLDGSIRLGFPQQPQWGIIDGSGHESGDFYFRPL